MMSSGTRLTVNLAGVNLGWFACVLGAAHGLHWLGPLVVTVLLVLHLILSHPRRPELLLAVVAGIFGFAFDSLLITGGVYEVERWLLPRPLAAGWLVALWVNFALILNTALRPFQGRWVLAAGIGFLGGPAAYYAGHGFGAVHLGTPVWRSIFLLGCSWALVIPLLLWVAKKLGNGSSPSPRGS